MPRGQGILRRSNRSRSVQEDASLHAQVEPEPEDQSLNHATEEESAPTQNPINRRTGGPNCEMPIPESEERRIFLNFEKKKEKEKGAPATYLEVFNKTHHTKGGKGDFVDKKSKKFSETYQAAMEEKYSDMTQAVQFDASIWADTIGACTTGRVYGFGSCHPSDILGDAHNAQSTWSRTTCSQGTGSIGTSRTDEEIDRIIDARVEERLEERMQEHLEERMQERLRMEMEHMRKQLEDSQRIQLQQMFNEQMAQQASYMMTHQASFVPPRAHQLPTTSGSSFPAHGVWYPSYGMYDAPSQGARPFTGQGSFGGQVPLGEQRPLGGQCPLGGSSSSGEHGNNV